jgi:hypothetical protein
LTLQRPVEQDLLSADSLAAGVKNSAKIGQVQRFFNTLYSCCTAKMGQNTKKSLKNGVFNAKNPRNCVESRCPWKIRLEFIGPGRLKGVTTPSQGALRPVNDQARLGNGYRFGQRRSLTFLNRNQRP